MGKPINLKEPPEAPVLSHDEYNEFSKKRQDIANKAGTANADIKKLYETAEKQGLHSAAFKQVDKLKKMQAGERADWLRGFDQYRGWENLDAQGDMIDGAQEAAE